jgi:hypothetical protein
MDTEDQKQEHLEQSIAKAMGGETPAMDPAGVEAPLTIPVHEVHEFPQDCLGMVGNSEAAWTHPTKLASDASADELTRHAQYLEWRSGLLTGEAVSLRSMAATR